MSIDRKTFCRQAEAVIALYRQFGLTISDAQLPEMQRAVEDALIRAWATERLQQLSASQIRSPIRSIRRVLRRLNPEDPQATRP